MVTKFIRYYTKQNYKDQFINVIKKNVNFQIPFDGAGNI